MRFLEWLSSFKIHLAQFDSSKRRRASRRSVVAAEMLESRVLLSAASFHSIAAPAASISHLGAPVTYAAGSAPVVVASGAAVTDTGNFFAGSKLQVSIAGGRHGHHQTSTTTADQFSIVSGGGVTLDGSGGVQYTAAGSTTGPTTIGAVTGGTGGTPLVISFNTSATQAGVQAVLDDIAYANSSSTPTAGFRVVAFQFTDGNGSSSRPARKLVHVTPAASITQLGSPVSYAAGGAPVVLASSAVVSDTSNAFANSKLNVSIGSWGDFHNQSAKTTGDQLSIVAAGGVTLDGSGGVLYNKTAIGTVTGGTGGTALVVAFNSSAMQAGVQAVADAVSYANSSSPAALGFRVVTFQFTDGKGAASLPASKGVKLTPAAAISQLGATVTYATSAAPVVVASSAVVTDTTNSFANSKLRVTVGKGDDDHHAFAATGTTDGTVASGDQLSIVANSTVTLNGTAVQFNGIAIGAVSGGAAGAPLVVTFNTAATQAGVQAVLDAVAFSNSSSPPVRGFRTIGFQFTDGTGVASLIARKQVQVTS